MRMLATVPKVALRALLVAAIAGAAGLPTARAESDNWKGPGWYQVFDDGQGIVMIWGGPYADEAACVSYVKGRLADKAYVASMIVKYGDPKVWGFDCRNLTADLPD